MPRRSRKGRFEAAEDGTIFLDEIGDLPLSIQTKLLRVLQEKEFERIGDSTPVKVHARIITATNRNLESLLQRGENQGRPILQAERLSHPRSAPP